MTAFIDEHRDVYGVEPICRALPIAPSTYYEQAARRVDPSRCPARMKQDAVPLGQIDRVWTENFEVYGTRKLWRALHREQVQAVRGKTVKTTRPDPARPCPRDLVNRQFKADRPNALWVSDFTYVSTWQGMTYVAFVVDVFARRIVGWRVSGSMETQFVLDALEQALHARRPAQVTLIHHSDQGSQYLSIRYSDRLAEAKIAPSVGSVGDSYDNALAETINGLYKTEVVHRRSWPTREALELATLKWVDWFNHRRWLSTIGNIPPAEAEAAYYAKVAEQQQTA